MIDPLVSPRTYSEVITGKPARVPPPMVRPGKAGVPSGLSISAKESAVLADIIHTPEVGALLALIKTLNRAFMSALIESGSLPVEGIATAPLVMDAGDTLGSAVLSG